MTKTPTRTDRRGFLKLAGLGLAATAGTATAEARPARDEKGKARYRETEHVRRYYELARF